MKDIVDFLNLRDIEAKITFESGSNFERVEFKCYDCDISIKIFKDTDLSDFLGQANNQYLNHIKIKRDLYKGLFEAFDYKYNNYEPLFTH